ncbi:glyoxalase superfamily protein [Leifsonia shinshuensis]|uniref:Catechol 2,3-dioxygenase-like lactoylglutathione lyase family enzyme n=1 Tax=Leifsonia shinshuensis TaxID=150026 RepID=A0A853CWY9_9MICO|nr:glyoxalase superfamily protein [Leifsonia shinshuensis]NYJ23684.1 catechol 2,3-dioxygenase-like lactoylglutathione lyase family enzyme [Leifsonia shinshuensis]
MTISDWRIELIIVPVSDVDRAKAFYVDALGWHADFDQRVSDTLRFVQVTPPGSACSIAFGEGLTDMAPGTMKGLQIVIPDADAALEHLRSNGIEAQGVDEQAWGRFVFFTDPDGNGWSLQQLVPQNR